MTTPFSTTPDTLTGVSVSYMFIGYFISIDGPIIIFVDRSAVYIITEPQTKKTTKG